jgi:hypothetical protein
MNETIKALADKTAAKLGMESYDEAFAEKLAKAVAKECNFIITAYPFVGDKHPIVEISTTFGLKLTYL